MPNSDEGGLVGGPAIANLKQDDLVEAISRLQLFEISDLILTIVEAKDSPLFAESVAERLTSFRIRWLDGNDEKT